MTEHEELRHDAYLRLDTLVYKHVHKFAGDVRNLPHNARISLYRELSKTAPDTHEWRGGSETEAQMAARIDEWASKLRLPDRISDSKKPTKLQASYEAWMRSKGLPPTAMTSAAKRAAEKIEYSVTGQRSGVNVDGFAQEIDAEFNELVAAAKQIVSRISHAKTCNCGCHRLRAALANVEGE